MRHFAVFSNWIFLRRSIVSLDGGRDVVLDLSETRLVDHTVMEKLHELESEFEQMNRKLIVTGLDRHTAVSEHPRAARTAVPGSATAPSSPEPVNGAVSRNGEE